MSFEREHGRAYARTRSEATDELDEIAPGRMSCTGQLASPGHPGSSGRMPSRHRLSHTILRKLEGGAPGRWSRSSALPAVMRSAEHAGIDPAAAELVARARRGGTPLDATLRSRLEVALGARLDGVRVHTGADADAAARALGARAFAIGDDVFFRDGAYDPQQREGQRLIAHEVAHTVQARGAAAPSGGGAMVSHPDDAFEREADVFADAFVDGLGEREAPAERPMAKHAGGAATIQREEAPAAREHEGHARGASAATVGQADLVPGRASRTAQLAAPQQPIASGLIPRKANEGGEDAGAPAGEQALNTAGYPIADPTPVYSEAEPTSVVLTNLPKGGSIRIIGTSGSFYVVQYDAIRKGYIQQADLDVDGTPTAVDVDPPAASGDPAATPAATPAGDKQTAGQRYRSAITKALDFWKGAVEGGADGKFAKFRSDKTLETARKNAGKEHKTFTTCIEFLGQVQSDAARDSHTKQLVTVDAKLATPEGRKKLPKDAWHAASPNMKERPKAGDVIFLTFAHDVMEGGKLKFGKGWFSHVGYFNGMGKVDPPAAAPSADPAKQGAVADPVELWHTVDGGQGTSTKYDEKGNMIGVHGHEELKESDRYYHPSKNLISGEKIQGDADERTLLGWVDIEKIVAADDPPDP